MPDFMPYDPDRIGYEDVADLITADNPDWAISPQEWEDDVKTWNPAFYRYMAVALEGDRLVAFGDLVEPAWSHQPGKYEIDANVATDRPELRLQTLHHLIDHAREKGAHIVECYADTLHPDRIEMLQADGFVENIRGRVSRLDLDAYDPAQFEDVRRRARENKLVIVTLGELLSGNDDWFPQAHEMYWEIGQDVPSTDPPQKMPLERFMMRMKSPIDNDPEASRFGLIDGEFVGMSTCARPQRKPDVLDTNMTGTLRSRRRQGIAAALKVSVADWAKAAGLRWIETGNEENNPMYDLNVRLGFRHAFDWIGFRKTLS